MSLARVAKRLRELDEQHRDDGDGGYALLAGIREYRRQLPEHEDQLLQCELVRLVEDEDVTLRGVALEALVEEWGIGISQQLSDVLSRSHFDAEWEGYVLFALLRLGHRPVEVRAATYISRRLLSGDRSVLPMAAALARVSMQQCLDIASTAIVDEIARDSGDKLKGYVPAFVKTFVEVDLTMLRELVRVVSEKDPRAGTILAKLLLGYLDLAYVQRDLGTTMVSALRESLAKST